MHEAGLMKSLMRTVHDVATQEQARRVTAVEVWLGALSHMSPDHFREHFEEAAKGSVAEGARLITHTSHDIAHPNAQLVVVRSIETED